MAKVIAIVGSYRKGGMVDSAVEAVLDGARSEGAETKKVYLIDEHIEFCRNCRECTQTGGDERGHCVIDDDFEKLIAEIEASDALVLGSPVNFFNVTAVFRRFMERLVSFADWPWGKGGPRTRKREHNKRAAIITSSAMPETWMPLATGAPRALKATADLLGAKQMAKLYVGMAAKEKEQVLAEDKRRRAVEIGKGLAKPRG